MPQLAKLIRDKYPGQYDDMDDASLETAVLRKHPEYADLAKPEENKQEQILNAAKRPFGVDEQGNNIIVRNPLNESTFEKEKPIDNQEQSTYQPHNILAEGRATEPQHEPDTWWGGFFKSLKDQALGTTIPALQGAAHPQSAGDFLSLLLPSELPNLRNFIPSLKGKLPQIAEQVRESPAIENIQRNAPYGEGSIMPSNVKPTELRGEGLPQENYPSVRFQEDAMPSPSPDLTPVGEEDA